MPHPLRPVLALSVLLAACAAPAPRTVGATSEAAPVSGPFAIGSAAFTPGEAVQLAPDVRVTRAAPGLWVHTTTTVFPGGQVVPANGVLLETPGGSVLFDTGWNERQTERLLAWARETLRRPVTRAVVTHAHGDRISGIALLRRAGIPSVGLGLTRELALRQRVAAPDSVPGLTGAPRRDPAGFELLYPGRGHAPDNIVVYFPRQRAVFGGCLVKPDTATTLGNVADADLPAWPRSVARVREAYPRARLVVPGHGAVGGASALAATERLIALKGAASPR